MINLSLYKVIIIDYISYAAYYIPVAYLFYRWRFMLFNPLHLSPPTIISVHLGLFLFYFVLFFVFLDSPCKGSYGICFSLSDLFHLV